MCLAIRSKVATDKMKIRFVWRDTRDRHRVDDIEFDHGITITGDR